MPATLNFLICGAQKSGTSALHYYLKDHPEIAISRLKELHIFDDENRNWNAESIQKIDNDIAHHFNIESQTKAIGEATPASLWWKPAMKRIWQYNPNMRLIAILRNPITRAYANWRMEQLRGKDQGELQLTLLEEEMLCRSALPQQHRVCSYLSRGFYSEQIRRAWQFFPREQLLILKQDDLLNNPQTTLETIYRFLNISKHSAQESINIPSWRTEEAKPEGMQNLLSIPKQTPSDIFFKLMDVYREEIKTLETMLNWNCDHWLTYSAH